MDSLLLEVLRFGTAILAGGLVAVIAQRIAFDHAQKLAAGERDARDAGLRRALLAELNENAGVCGELATDLRVGAPRRTTRGAWDAARATHLMPATLELLLRAYAAGERYAALVDVILSRSAGADTDSMPWRILAQREGKRAHEAFEKAREELRKA